MKTYNNLQIRTLFTGILMADGGDPPKLGEKVLIDGKQAEVVASRNELVNDTSMEKRFIAVYTP